METPNHTTAIFYRHLFLPLLLLLPFSVAAADLVAMDRFGLHVHGLAKNNPWPSVPFGFIRLWDSNTTWRDLEPEKGKWCFKVLDRYVAAANAHGVEILLTLGQTPPWAAVDRCAASPYGAGASSPPRSLEDWQRYVFTLARRYRGRIRHWEVWNEFNVKHFWSGDILTLVEMEKIAAAVLSRVDPHNFLLTPSVQGGAYGRLDRYLAAGGGRYADGIAYHFYAPRDEPEAVRNRIERVRSVMRGHGLDAKPLWNTEMGWLLANRDGGFGRSWRPGWERWRQVGYDEAAGFVMRAYLVNFACGVDRVFWYAWNNGAMGLAEDRGARPKPAAAGYACLAGWLKGAKLLDCREVQKVWIYRIHRNGALQRIVWCQKQQILKLPDHWKVRQRVGINGSEKRIGGGSILIGPEPVLLCGDGGKG